MLVNMGKTKKRSTSQIKKQKPRSQKKSGQQKRVTKNKIFKAKASGIDRPSVSDKDLSIELIKMKAITPYALAKKYNVNLSVAKDWLNVLEREGTIQKMGSSGALRIYKFGRNA